MIACSGSPVFSFGNNWLYHLIILNGSPWLGLAIPGVSRDDIPAYDYQVRVFELQDLSDKFLVECIGGIFLSKMYICELHHLELALGIKSESLVASCSSSTCQQSKRDDKR